MVRTAVGVGRWLGLSGTHGCAERDKVHIRTPQIYFAPSQISVKLIPQQRSASFRDRAIWAEFDLGAKGFWGWRMSFRIRSSGRSLQNAQRRPRCRGSTLDIAQTTRPFSKLDKELKCMSSKVVATQQPQGQHSDVVGANIRPLRRGSITWERVRARDRPLWIYIHKQPFIDIRNHPALYILHILTPHVQSYTPRRLVNHDRSTSYCPSTDPQPVVTHASARVLKYQL